MNKTETQSGDDLAAALAAARAVEDSAPASSIVFSGAFDAASENGVRRSHASAALEAADDLQFLEYQDLRMFIAAKFMAVGREPFVLLVVGNESRKERQITAAYRLYGEDSETASDALLAFQRFLERFGLYFRADERWVLFVPVLTVVPDAEGNTTLIELQEQDEGMDWVIGSSIRRNADGSTSIAWPFAINTTRYKQELNRRQGA